MTIVGTGSSGSAITKTNYPVEEGRTAGTTKLVDDYILQPEKSYVREIEGVAL